MHDGYNGGFKILGKSKETSNLLERLYIYIAMKQNALR